MTKTAATKQTIKIVLIFLFTLFIIAQIVFKKRWITF